MTIDLVRGTHHLTLSVGSAQEDYDFHTQLLGLKVIKKTVLFDGTLPVYHLYYGNGNGDASTLLTTFPYQKLGLTGRRGSNQTKRLNLDVPAASLNFWADRLHEYGVAFTEHTQFGEDRLRFAHPCGIEYSLVGRKAPDPREPWGGNGVPTEHAIRGANGITASVQVTDEMSEFLTAGLGAKELDREGDSILFELGNSGEGRNVELLHEPNVLPGTWKFGAGTVHHFAVDVGNAEDQQAIKDNLNGLGYTDVSERKDRQYFYSCYVRSPGGSLFELAYSRPEGFMLDESAEDLGRDFMLPPRFEDRREEIFAKLEPIDQTRDMRFQKS